MKARLLDAMCMAAEAAWPTVRMERDAFAAYVEQHEAGRELVALGEPRAGEDDKEATARVDGEAAAELWICAALARRDPNAAKAFDQRYFAPLPAALQRLRLADHELDELMQLLRMKLLVPSPHGDAGTSAKLLIERYAGRGKLAGFVKVTATREAISRFRKRSIGDAQAAPFDPELLFLPAPGTDPGLQALKGATRAAFREALAVAFEALEPRERNLLRLHLLGGVTLDKLATMHGAHRATIVRWLRDARERVLDRTRAELSGRLGVRADEVDSLIGLATSHLDLTLERLLRTEGAAPLADDGDQ